MHFIRSWPTRIPAGRSYVVDELERVELENCDYAPLQKFAGEDLLLLEWDIAVSQEDMRTFAQRAQDTPTRVVVAPYRIYADAYNLGRGRDVWAHRYWDGEPRGKSYPGNPTPVPTGAPVCQLFGLGMVYLPHAVVAQWFADRWATHFGDVEFSMWHYLRVRQDVSICWDVRPVHLNYLAETVREEFA